MRMHIQFVSGIPACNESSGNTVNRVPLVRETFVSSQLEECLYHPGLIEVHFPSGTAMLATCYTPLHRGFDLSVSTSG